jgi:hypothetical protein
MSGRSFWLATVIGVCLTIVQVIIWARLTYLSRMIFIPIVFFNFISLSLSWSELVAVSGLVSFILSIFSIWSPLIVIGAFLIAVLAGRFFAERIGKTNRGLVNILLALFQTSLYFIWLWILTQSLMPWHSDISMPASTLLTNGVLIIIFHTIIAMIYSLRPRPNLAKNTA